jgi:sec-independent protein translocase protein TatB
MFDLELSKLLVLGVVALLVIKPKDLPKTLKTLGYWVRHARQVASEFQGSIEQMVRDAELADVKKDIEDATRKITTDIEKTIDPAEIEKALGETTTPDPMSHVISSTPPATPPATEPSIEAPAAQSGTSEATPESAAGAADEPTLPFPDLPVAPPATGAASGAAPASGATPAPEPLAAKAEPHDRV